MPFLLSLITPRSLFWAAIFALLAAVGVQTMRLDNMRARLATERADRAVVERERAEMAAVYAKRVASIEREHAITQQRLADEFQKEKDRLAADVDRLRADGDGLRADVEAWTARAASAAADTAACRNLANRARLAGKLFGDADRLAEKLARAAEQRNAEVRALKAQLEADRAACEANTK